jgi:hypothetical protein
LIRQIAGLAPARPLATRRVVRLERKVLPATAAPRLLRLRRQKAPQRGNVDVVGLPRQARA